MLRAGSSVPLGTTVTPFSSLGGAPQGHGVCSENSPNKFGSPQLVEGFRGWWCPVGYGVYSENRLPSFRNAAPARTRSFNGAEVALCLTRFIGRGSVGDSIAGQSRRVRHHRQLDVYGAYTPLCMCGRSALSRVLKMRVYIIYMSSNKQRSNICMVLCSVVK